MGPWRHSQVNYDGSPLGALNLDGDTALQFRRDVLQAVLQPVSAGRCAEGGHPAGADLQHRRKPLGPLHAVAAGGWHRASRFTWVPAAGCRSRAARAQPKYDEYVSDPAKPVPFVPRPVRFADRDSRGQLAGARPALRGWPSGRADLSSPSRLTAPLRVAGAPQVNLYASTSGTDSDWVVKLIDVYPDQMPPRQRWAATSWRCRWTIFRGRYRESFSEPEADRGRTGRSSTRFGLPTVDHMFLPGHRVMVQVQSSLFPLYDRNPQTFVPNIYLPSRATIRRPRSRSGTRRSRRASLSCRCIDADAWITLTPG